MAAGAEKRRRGWLRPGMTATLIALPGVAVLVSLGIWQLQRLEWKTDMIAAMEVRRGLDAVDLPSAIAEPASWEFRPVRVSGSFRHDDAFRLMGRVHDGRLGVRLLTPLVRDDGGAVLVDRGWVPSEPDGTPATHDRTPGRLPVEGEIRLPEPPNPFTPDNRPAENAWYSIDTVAMGDAAGLALAPFYLQVTGGAGDGYPLPLARPIEPVNNHLQYAVTWFALAAALAGVYVLAHLRRRGRET